MYSTFAKLGVTSMVLLYIILFGGIKKYSVILIRIWCWGDDLVRESRLGRGMRLEIPASPLSQTIEQGPNENKPQFVLGTFLLGSS